MEMDQLEREWHESAEEEYFRKQKMVKKDPLLEDIEYEFKRVAEDMENLREDIRTGYEDQNRLRSKMDYDRLAVSRLETDFETLNNRLITTEQKLFDLEQLIKDSVEKNIENQMNAAVFDFERKLQDRLHDAKMHMDIRIRQQQEEHDRRMADLDNRISLLNSDFGRF